jgi:O-acetyl-ADP-ribose deacetylase (regulator of RNase III)
MHPVCSFICSRRLLKLEVHCLACIVTSQTAQALVNPGNNELKGTSELPYFPVGGPVPPPPPKGFHNSTGWGGLEVGPGQKYPAQTVDGLVTQYGGAALREEIAKVPYYANEVHPESGRRMRCRDGDAVMTSSGPGSLLAEGYEFVIHTVPPFDRPHGDTQWQLTLTKCYHAVVELALARRLHSVALPVLAAGARGVPMREAIHAAVEGLSTFSYTASGISSKGAGLAGLTEVKSTTEMSRETPTKLTVKLTVVDLEVAKAVQRAVRGSPHGWSGHGK